MSIKKVNTEEFAKILMDNTSENPIEFNIYQDYPNSQYATDYEGSENWYFAKRMNASGYGSSFIILDECWYGNHAFAIPLDIYGNNTYENMVKYVTMFFDHIQNIKHTKINHVYVDIQEG